MDTNCGFVGQDFVVNGRLGGGDGWPGLARVEHKKSGGDGDAGQR